MGSEPEEQSFRKERDDRCYDTFLYHLPYPALLIASQLQRLQSAMLVSNKAQRIVQSNAVRALARLDMRLAARRIHFSAKDSAATELVWQSVS